MSTATVRLENVSKIYGASDHRTAGVIDVSMTVSAGELVLLLGPSGSGKTTLLTLIAGFVQPTSGSVKLFDDDIKSYSASILQQLRATKIGFIFQTFRLIDALKVVENIELTLSFAGKSRKKGHLRSIEMLKRFDIEHLAQKYPGRLSQGEKQRVAIARAVANDAQLILADEPTASLAAEQGSDIIQLLHHYARSMGKCVLVASHDLRLKANADRILKIENGSVL
jgi:putative ABC transport system ATP-binding protein